MLIFRFWLILIKLFLYIFSFFVVIVDYSLVYMLRIFAKAIMTSHWHILNQHYFVWDMLPCFGIMPWKKLDDGEISESEVNGKVTSKLGGPSITEGWGKSCQMFNQVFKRKLVRRLCLNIQFNFMFLLCSLVNCLCYVFLVKQLVNLTNTKMFLLQ